MKIVFYRHSLLSRGGDKMIVAHASHLAASGFDVVIMTNFVSTVFRLHPAVRLEPLPWRGKIGTILSAMVQKVDADVLIADIIPLAFLLSVRNRKKILYFAQDYDESYYNTLPAKLAIRLLYYATLRFAHVPVLAVGRALCNLLRSRYKADVALVENGIDTDLFFSDPAPDLISQKQGRPAVLILARSDRRKGFDIAIKVMRLLLERMPDIEVWTVGEHVTRCFQTDRHRDFGYVGERTLRRIMSSCEVFLYPTRHEGFGLMVCEAFACGTGVVTTSGVPFAQHGVNALVVPVDDVMGLADAVEEMIRYPERWTYLREAATAFAAEHSLRRTVAAFEVQVRNRVESRG